MEQGGVKRERIWQNAQYVHRVPCSMYGPNCGLLLQIPLLIPSLCLHGSRLCLHARLPAAASLHVRGGLAAALALQSTAHCQLQQLLQHGRVVQQRRAQLTCGEGACTSNKP